MKENFLLFSFLLGCSTTLGVQLEKNMIRIEYNTHLEHQSIKFGLPYRITITNRSNEPIKVDPSIIGVNLLSYWA